MSAATLQLRIMLETWRDFQNTSRQEAEKAARMGNVAEQRARQAEARTINVCISDVEDILTEHD